jgi:16S rRNA G966 N2-methylase RsmD
MSSRRQRVIVANLQGNRRTKKANNLYNTALDTEYLKNLDYPYLDKYTSLDDIKARVKQLHTFKPIIVTEIPSINEVIKPYNNINNINNIIIFKENYYKYKRYYDITDYFSNRCRAMCIFKNPKTVNQLSPYYYYNKHKTNIHQNIMNRYGKITYHLLREYIYKNTKECSNFNVTIVVSLLQLFKPKHWLDFSAGWGDRLIGAIAYGKCKYTGVDPSECMNDKINGYTKIINTLVSNKNDRHKYKIIKSGFETLTKKEIPDDTYDLIFTSPPFFDLEIYEDKTVQSISKYNSLNKWLNGFLYPSLRICYRALEKKGVLALYISDYNNVKYIDTMKKWIHNNLPNLKDTGNIYWWNDTNTKTIRTIYTWTKIN